MREIICIGHITHDHIVTPDIDLHIPGGTAWYFAWGMQALAASDPNPSSPYRLITAVGEEDMPAVEQLRKAGVRVEVLPSQATVYFENKYGHNMNNRQQRVLSKAAPFTWPSSLQGLLGQHNGLLRASLCVSGSRNSIFCSYRSS